MACGCRCGAADTGKCTCAQIEKKHESNGGRCPNPKPDGPGRSGK